MTEYVEVQWPEGMRELFAELGSSVIFLLAQVVSRPGDPKVRTEAEQHLRRLAEVTDLLKLGAERDAWRKRQPLDLSE